MQVDPERAVIAVDGRAIGAASALEYLLLNKPAGVTSTVRDRHASRTVLELLPTALVPEGARLYPVGRLDQDSEGLLILTNDGGWADRVLHPRHGVEREYAIGLRALAHLRAGRRTETRHRARGRAWRRSPASDRRPSSRPPGLWRSSTRLPDRSSGIARSWPRVGSGSCAGCSERSVLRSSGSSGCGSGRSGSTTCEPAGHVVCERRRSAGSQVVEARAGHGPRRSAAARSPAAGPPRRCAVTAVRTRRGPPPDRSAARRGKPPPVAPQPSAILQPMDTSERPRLVVALDGPGSSGKSSVGAAAALAVGYRFCDTGLLYRAVTWLSLARGVPATDPERLAALVDEVELAPDERRPAAAGARR